MGKILVMEDEPNHIFIVQHSLKKIGHEVFACSHPNNFMSVLEQTQPDLILMDINLPQIDGLTLIKKVRMQAEFVNVPIVVLTAVPIDDIREQAKENGSNIFLEKPIRIAALRRVVEELLEPAPAEAPEPTTTTVAETKEAIKEETTSSPETKPVLSNPNEDKTTQTHTSESKKVVIPVPKPNSLPSKA